MNGSSISLQHFSVLQRPSAKLEVALLLNVAMEHISVKVVHHDAAFLLDLLGMQTSLALDSSAERIR